MIHILSTRAHAYTHRKITRLSEKVQLLSYEDALIAGRLQRGTYIFTDLDRLGYWDLELAADLYRQLGRAGCRVLNDPARVLQRYALLNRLLSLGINDFAAWRADEGVLPDRFPVFLRTQSAHRGVLSELLHSPAEAEEALERAIGDAYPLRDLMFVEYRAQATDGLFWKHTVFRLGDTFVAGPSVLDRNWVSKFGIKGLASEEHFQHELDIVTDGRFIDQLRPAFEAANIDYGRADFTLADGRLAVYEINTNPDIKFTGRANSATRALTQQHIRTTFMQALETLDCQDGRRHPIELASSRFRKSSWPARMIRRHRTP